MGICFQTMAKLAVTGAGRLLSTASPPLSLTMPSPHGMDRELRRTIALSRALLRTLGPCSQQPAVTAEETSSALAAIEDGLPFITHPILPPSVALQLHSLAQQSFKDSCRIAIETCGLKNISALQARTVHIKNSWLKMYTQKVEDMVSACSQKMKTQKQIADVSFFDLRRTSY